MLGLVHAAKADAAAREGKDSIQDIIENGVPTVRPDEPLSSLFGMFVERSVPIAVTDENDRLLGVVVKGAVLDELASAGEHNG